MSKLFTRGYAPVREKVGSGFKFIRICQNCAWFDKEEGSKEHECTNNDVTKYDLIFEGGNVSCTQWTPYTDFIVERPFNKGGRDAFENLLEE